MVSILSILFRYAAGVDEVPNPSASMTNGEVSISSGVRGTRRHLVLLASDKGQMANWKLTLAYDGTGFHGWQVQPGLSTIQGTLAGALRHVTGETVLPQGSGRTDAGVHALAQVASVALEVPIPAENLLRALNRALPASIRVLSAEAVEEGFHARHSARRKTYEYRIFDGRRLNGDLICPPFLAPYVWDCRYRLEFEAMKRATEDFCGTHDFTSFAATDPDLAQRQEGVVVSPMRTVFAADLVREGELMVFRVTGSGFLHHMVRNLLGTLVEVGRGAMAAEAIPEVLAARNRAAAGPTAPANGLFLRSVEY
jgi:tRNA pseudouridine38-40 synthase